ncbi:hypothetical protein T484DRAFT_1795272, partial [Baffinella frigidus]
MAFASPSPRTLGPVPQGSSGEMVTSRLTHQSPSFVSNAGGTLRWRIGRLIGEGAYARVFQCINADTGELMAVKQVSLLGVADGKRGKQ